MAAKRVVFWCISILIVAGLVGGHPGWAADKSGTSTIDKGRASSPEAIAPGPGEPIEVAADSTGQGVPEGGGAAEDGSQCQSCPNCCCAPMCAGPDRFWLRADYLMWWTSGMKLPPLVSTGVLGAPGVLEGDSTIGADGRSGFRTTVGMWLGCQDVWALQFDYLSLGERDTNFFASSADYPTLGRPIYDMLLIQPGAEPVNGTIAVATKDYFQSAGALLSYNVWNCGARYAGPAVCDSCDGEDCIPLPWSYRMDALAGFRYYNLSDAVVIDENTTVSNNSTTTYQIEDNFRARNDFYGSELGLRMRATRGPWAFDFTMKVAAGNTHETVTITGLTTDGGTTNSGVLASGANLGTFQRDEFTMIPELSMEVGYQVNRHLRAYVGYDILYWGCVQRAADQIDVMVDPLNVKSDPNYAPSAALPAPTFPDRQTSFWAQGVNVGVELKF